MIDGLFRRAIKLLPPGTFVNMGDSLRVETPALAVQLLNDCDPHQTLGTHLIASI